MENFVNEFKKGHTGCEIVSEIGRDTWRVEYKKYNRTAVLKKVNNAGVYEKLQKLNIKGIPEIYEIFEINNESYIIEECIEGLNLKEKLLFDRELSKNEVHNIISQLCDILDKIHGANIIHRDIKPSNIILTFDNQVYLIDFGIARNKNDYSSSDTTHLGTEFYASPEQYGFAQTDNRSDIYSVGKLMIVLLTGRESVLNIKAIPYSGVIKKCIAVDADKRYNSAVSLKRAVNIYYKKYFVISAAIIFSGVAVMLLFFVIMAGGNMYMRNYTEPVTEYTTDTAVTTAETTMETTTETTTETATEGETSVREMWEYIGKNGLIDIEFTTRDGGETTTEKAKEVYEEEGYDIGDGYSDDYYYAPEGNSGEEETENTPRYRGIMQNNYEIYGEN